MHAIKSRKHKRGKKTSRRSYGKTILNIDYLNIRGMTSKIHEVNKHLKYNNVGIFGLVETFLKNNSRPPNLDTSYCWVGKTRQGSKEKGGIGICLKSHLPLLDENLLDSKSDLYERLWTLTRINNVKTAIGVVYFPNDGTNKSHTDELMFQLLDETSRLNAMGYEILLMGDFNGRCVGVCEHTGKNKLCSLPSYNGSRLLQFIDASQMIVANTMNCCTGHFTRILNNQRSAIDYVFLTKSLSENVSSVVIDDSGRFDLHSDHVLIRLTLICKPIVQKKTQNEKCVWKINDKNRLDPLPEKT
ncbi:Hypothetical predicted protein [Mytilus galloprovincialis]|uniref:Endonuclease/exonuclease/phosphatase domain-containing protein n=1 Tax=Mytilus galloprovincialis TaxID=29158 RepID=A0A8B6H4R9_MYTGA|nr:Hypothetical predicted protein [Mytilus galloprovincialis]